MRRFLSAAIVAAASVAMSVPASANLMVNGSFEGGPSSGFSTVSGAAIPGWTITGNVDWIGDYWQPADGTNSLDMNGFDSQATVAQTVSGLVPGTKYLLSFALSGNPDNGAEIKTLDLNIDGSLAGSFSFNTAGISHGNMNWANESLSFVATGASETIAFQSTTNNCCYGPALDNVSLVASAVPEPISLSFLAGGLAMAGSLRRRALARAS